MKRLQQQKGFTLVELAIVLTIIGLLIGGILKGQQLITNARVTAQMAQVQGVEAATTTFNDTYQGLPGDLTTATTRVAKLYSSIVSPMLGRCWQVASAKFFASGGAAYQAPNATPTPGLLPS